MLKSEKEILLTIKYLPVLLVLLVSLIFTVTLYKNNINEFEEKSLKLEKEYKEHNKHIVKYQVKRVQELIKERRLLSLDKLRKSLKLQVDNAHKIALSIYENNKSKSKEELKKLIKDALRDIRFNENRGYLFVYSLDGKNILHPVKPNLEDKSLWNYQDTKGTYLLQEMNKILKRKDATYYSWYWTKPDDKNTEYEKMGYFKLFEPFNWFIGTGEYVDDFQKAVKSKLQTMISNIRYEENNYIFLLNLEGEFLSIYDKNLLGKSVFDLNIVKDADNIFDKIITTVNNNGGYVTYVHNQRPQDDKKIKKISYVDKVNEWKWIIGSGFYMDKFYEGLEKEKTKLYEQNQKKITELLIGSLILTIIFIFIFNYISKLLERKFLTYKNQLEKKVLENKRKDELMLQQSKMAAMGEMIGNITHQWKQPLSTISTVVSGMKLSRELNQEIDLENEKQNLDNIHTQVNYLSHTIDDFRDFFKIDKEFKKVDLKELVDKTKSLIQIELRNNNIDLINNIPNEIYAHTLENELIQVLINIFNNAKDELKKYERGRFIIVEISLKDSFIELYVKNNAGYINKDIITKIFNPYFTTKENKKGTGLGLHMSKEIVTKHLDGDLKVENQEIFKDDIEYEGVSFTVSLPKEL